MYFFFVFFGYFKKRCYFCNRLAEMASKAMAKSCCVIRLIQVRVLQILREFRTYLFPVLVSLALDPYLGILCPIVLKKRIVGTEWMVSISKCQKCWLIRGNISLIGKVVSIYLLSSPILLCRFLLKIWICLPWKRQTTTNKEKKWQNLWTT